MNIDKLEIYAGNLAECSSLLTLAFCTTAKLIWKKLHCHHFYFQEHWHFPPSWRVFAEKRRRRRVTVIKFILLLKKVIHINDLTVEHFEFHSRRFDLNRIEQLLWSSLRWNKFQVKMNQIVFDAAVNNPFSKLINFQI